MHFYWMRKLDTMTASLFYYFILAFFPHLSIMLTLALNALQICLRLYLKQIPNFQMTDFQFSV